MRRIQGIRGKSVPPDLLQDHQGDSRDPDEMRLRNPELGGNHFCDGLDLLGQAAITLCRTLGMGANRLVNLRPVSRAVEKIE